ncbi:MAG: transcriptional regulator [Herpetosiphonaceae bacterium]|nr:MAG: transcriptional regulator [Herpetosiphonaceae bacterium]
MSVSSSKRILVVDDDRLLAEMISKILAYAGYEVTIVTTAEEAYDLALREPPALLMTDILLPGIDGYTLSRRLRQDQALRQLPILIVTGQYDVSDKIAGYEVAADGFLIKPFQPLDLLKRVDDMLAPAHQRDRYEEHSAHQGRLIAVLGAKGGVGATTIASNLAVLLRMHTGGQIILCDADLYGGDAGLYLNVTSSRTLVSLAHAAEELSPSAVIPFLVPHPSGIQILVGPACWEDISLVTSGWLQQVLVSLTNLSDYVLVDCQSWYDERTLAALRQADVVMLIVTPEIGPLKNLSLFLQRAPDLGLSPDRIHLVLNHTNADTGIDSKTIEHTLRRTIDLFVFSGGRAVVSSTNRGVPLVLEQPAHPFAQQMEQIAAYVIAAASDVKR